MRDRITLVTCGPTEHGICRFGRDLAETAQQQDFTGTVLHHNDPHLLAAVVDRVPGDTRLLHLQANDWLFTDRTHRAEEAVLDLAALLRIRRIVLSLTLHDLPQQAVSRELFLRRARSYAAMAGAAVGVVVSSEHERLLLEEAAAILGSVDGPAVVGQRMPPVEVIPLPVRTGPRNGPDDRPGHRREARAAGPVHASAPVMGVLGFIYPGKGHREVLEELASTRTPVALVAIGRPSDGHAAMLPDLIDLGRRLGIEFTSTGFVPDGALAAHLRGVAVPIAPAPHVSASASVNSWIAAGRRPLVPASRYAQELCDRMPGAVRIYEPGELCAAVESALADPSLTYLPPGFRPHPDRTEAASRYLRWLRSIAASSTR
ncbi:hypothetical protein [Nakamurella sp. PAMC28650]|uniref:hypothetical protein n=1 Tax=Nakamurella sp. PAMC28650 TaxID=2762325 RepID=UPI00164E36BD|nr:hypothetical protein [Nakamurella sp. PAMC28650]QNK80304.1 hypothetical protein H7F38_19215 [Nakamurella sp. PAMC28650]